MGANAKRSEVPGLLADAAARRGAGDWASAATLYARAAALLPADAAVWQNLALSRYAAGERGQAADAANRALGLDPALWQARALVARVARDAGQAEAAAEQWARVLALDPANAAALTALADLQLNVFGDAAAADALAARLPHGDADAELTRLMAALYTGAVAPGALSEGLRAFARRHLQLARVERPARAPGGRPRVGLVSPMFCASPVFFLTFTTWAALAGSHELVFFDRGVRADRATERFRGLAAEWHPVRHLEPATLAARMAEAGLDAAFDLGGWSDAAALSAFSARPAPRQFTWVGGQSATTGLDAFDGWIGDRWQSPAQFQRLYAEPLLAVERGYCDYAEPPALAALRDVSRHGVALVGNPVKVTDSLAAGWPDGVSEVTLIDRRYARGVALERVRSVLDRMGVRVAGVEAPETHADYLAAVARHRAIVNTAPYSAGLTAVEAYRMGVRVLGVPSGGPLFAQRHLLSHARTRGRNPTLPGQIAALISAPTPSQDR